MAEKQNIRRTIPSVDRVLQDCQDLLETWGHTLVSNLARDHLDKLRTRSFTENSAQAHSIDAVRSAIENRIFDITQRSIRPVFNLSGIVLHTNLGRACMPEKAAEAARLAGIYPTNLEYDLRSGKRGNRDHHAEHLICELTGCEAATIVNNGAAAVVLLLTALAKGRDVPVSRGELVEIGGSFRMPEIMEAAGCKLVEVGATNRTRLSDYERAICRETALLLKIHTSNYRIDGFTESVGTRDFIALAHKHDLPCAFDLGSGCLVDYTPLGLPKEPIASDYITKGADLITFSGDKLLGGPQCGIIAGKKSLIDKIRSHPLKRALRPDAMTYAALAEVLKLYRHPETLKETLPALRHMTRASSDIETQVDRLCPALLRYVQPNFNVVKTPCRSQIGSGSFPSESLNSFAISITSTNAHDSDIRRLSSALRNLTIPVISRLHDGEILLDLRCLDDEDKFLGQLPELRDSLLC